MFKGIAVIISIALLQAFALFLVVPGYNLYFLTLSSILTCSLVWILARYFRKEELVVQEKEISDKIINSLPGIFYLYDRDRQFIRWNKNFELASGYTSEDFAKLHPLDFYDVEEKELLNEKIEAVFQNGADEVEAMLLTRDGRKIPYYFNGSRANFNGKDYLLGMGINITRLKIAEEKILHAYKENEITLSRISDAVVSLDLNWRYTFLNDAALATHPDGRAGTIGKTILEVHPELDGTEFWSMYQESMRDMKVLRAESYYAPMDTWFSATAYPSSSGLTIFYQDITERKRAEQQKLDLILKLQAKNKDLRQFSYIVSHNLRAPVAKIAALGELLRDSPNDRELVELIVKETQQLDNIVMDMNLIVAARRSDHVGTEQVNFASVLDGVKKSLQNEIDASAGVISATFNVPGLTTVKSHVDTILHHLVSNAIKFRKQDAHPVIQIQTTSANDFVCLSVTDNGRGIDLRENIEKIFGLYKKFHSDNIPGRGVGLNLVKAHAETLGGYVEVESEINKGSTFRIYLPLKYSAAP